MIVGIAGGELGHRRWTWGVRVPAGQTKRVRRRRGGACGGNLLHGRWVARSAIHSLEASVAPAGRWPRLPGQCRSSLPAEMVMLAARSACIGGRRAQICSLRTDVARLYELRPHGTTQPTNSDFAQRAYGGRVRRLAVISKMDNSYPRPQLALIKPTALAAQLRCFSDMDIRRREGWADPIRADRGPRRAFALRPRGHRGVDRRGSCGVAPRRARQSDALGAARNGR